MRKIILCILSSLMIIVASCRKDPEVPGGVLNPTNDDTVTWQEGMLPGVFSVGEDVHVYFSQGNLQFQASTNTWRFAERQWEIVGENNSNVSQSYQGWIDLFGWGTSGYDHGAVCYQPWNTMEDFSCYYAYGQEEYNLYDQSGQADWGYNAISNGGDETGVWRTLTHDEWEYLFDTRNTFSGIRYAKAIVNGVKGVILLPDSWSSSFFALNAPNTSDANYSSNVISLSEWSVLEQRGAVLLPAAGGRNGTSVSVVDSCGYYWSASFDSSSEAWLLSFRDSNLNAVNNYRYYGFSVRLVRSAQDHTFSINVTANPADGGIVSGGGNYELGDDCTLTATANEGYIFVYWTDNGEVVSTDAEYTFMVIASKELVANFVPIYHEPMNALRGLFSVSDDRQVCFSTGNLQYRASTRTWRFAPNQYDRIGEDNANISEFYDGWIDLFGWGTSGYNHGAECYQPWSTSSNSSYYYVYGSSSYHLYDQTGQADWGYAVSVQEGNASLGWRTLTEEEWRYLFEERNTVSDIRYVQAEVKGVNGVILLPDNWNTNYYNLNYLGGYSSNIINVATWTLLEQHGAVFLPAAGQRFETSVNYLGYVGHYWSSSSYDISQAKYVNLSNSYVGVGTDSRSNGNSVRLVLTPQESTHGFINVTSNPLGGGVVTGEGVYPLDAECTLVATANMGFSFTSWMENGAIVSTDPTYTFTVTGSRNLVAVFVLSGDDENGILKGFFSVAVDRQVQFSKGNLQYQASSNTWRFAEHQWDVVGEDNNNISQSYNGWIDLFGWGTSGWNNGNTYYQPWDYNNANAEYGPVGKFDLVDDFANSDWGVYNAISNGGNQPGIWRTMEQMEWDYLLFSRNTVSGIRFAKAQVNGTNGLVLLPDDWNANEFPLNNTNAQSAQFASNPISLAQWNILEQQGAVFLPASGYRNENTVANVGSSCAYWTTWFYTANTAYYVNGTNTNLNAAVTGFRPYGRSVRLVYSPLPISQEHLLEVTTTEITNVTSNAATCSGNVVAENLHFVLESGICWSVDANPTIEGNHSATSSPMLGVFSKKITDLNPGVTYHVRAYAKNKDQVFYGADKTFVTEVVVTTSEPTSITSFAAILRGSVSSMGMVSERGMCWSTSSTPTIEGVHQEATSSGSGSFSVKVTDFTPGTAYYVRAYAITDYGVVYGNEITFVTRAEVTTAVPYDITATSAICGGEVVSDPATIIEMGICWGTNVSPTVAGNHIAYSTVAPGTFTLMINGLEPEKPYHVRAYVTNSSGTSYGKSLVFTTLPASASPRIGR